MYDAKILEGPDKGSYVQFRTLTGLTRRLGGTRYQVDHETAFEPPHRTLAILHRPRGSSADDAWHVATRALVPTEAIRELDEGPAGRRLRMIRGEA